MRDVGVDGGLSGYTQIDVAVDRRQVPQLSNQHVGARAVRPLARDDLEGDEVTLIGERDRSDGHHVLLGGELAGDLQLHTRGLGPGDGLGERGRHQQGLLAPAPKPSSIRVKAW